MGTRKLAALFAVAALAVTLVGAGVSATFTDQAVATQDINVGNMSLMLASSTPGAAVSPDGKTLTCPAVWVTKSHGDVSCNVYIYTVGNIVPDHVALKLGVTTNGAALSKFWVAPFFNATPGAWDMGYDGSTWTLDTSNGQTIGVASSFPTDVTNWISWLNLTNSDYNKWVTVTYTLDAVA